MTTEPSTQVARVRWLLEEASKATGHAMSPEAVGRLTAQVCRLLRENKLCLEWQSTFDNAIREMEPNK